MRKETQNTKDFQCALVAYTWIIDKVTVLKLGLGNQDYLPKQTSTSKNFPMTEELVKRKHSFLEAGLILVC